MNLVVDEAEEFGDADKGIVNALGMIVIRGSSVVQIECLERT